MSAAINVLSPAGKTISRNFTARDCLTEGTRPATPPSVKVFQGSTRPGVGEVRVLHSLARDPTPNSEHRHGVTSHASFQAKDLLNPNSKTRFQQTLLNSQESIYSSHKKAPLGKTPDPTSNLPNRPELLNNTLPFGNPTVYDDTASEIINPLKAREQVEQEHMAGSELYKVSHNTYPVGEMVDRNYEWTVFTKDSCYGVETPHDVRGTGVSHAMKWLHEAEEDKASHIVQKRLNDFRERVQPQIGKVHDPISDTLNVSDDHSFGVQIKPDEYGAGDLIHMRNSENILRGKDYDRGKLAFVRQQLKKANFHNFHSLKAAFEFYDKHHTGKITNNDLMETCYQFGLPLDYDGLSLLMRACDTDNKGYINYIQFCNFLNWKDKMPTGIELVTEISTTHDEAAEDPEDSTAKHTIEPLPTERKKENEELDESEYDKQLATAEDLTYDKPKRKLTPKVLTKQIDSSALPQHTSSKAINATVGGIPTLGYQTFGVPTVRADLPAPIVKRVSDYTNYGDESDAFGLLYPSLYSSRGVYEKDFFAHRSKENIREFFKNIQVEIDDAAFEEVWRRAEILGDGKVSIEVFRTVLDQLAYEQTYPV